MLMGKKIIICCDGTGNQLGETYSNVVKIYSVIKKIPGKQIAFYDPGVGTFSYSNVVIPLWRRIKQGIDLALGLGLEENVTQAYSFLMENYEDGDEVFLFGFSRGAYTTRVLAGLITQMGLLQKGCQNLIPYAWDSYRLCYKKEVKKVSKQFKDYYAREVKIRFLGIWDTVSSIGLLFGYKHYPNTLRNHGVEIVRHAMAIDERRRFYRTNMFKKNRSTQDIKQVWFAGVHSDVGGSYPLNESGLAQVSLKWMIREAAIAKIEFDDELIKQVIPSTDQADNSAPSYAGKIHKSLTGGWWLAELWPKRIRTTGKIRMPLGEPRAMYIDPSKNEIVPVIHRSVQQRIDDKNLNYAPKNLMLPSKSYKIED